MKLFAISVDSPDDSKGFAEDNHFPFTLLSDADGSLSAKYTGFNGDGTAIPGVVVVRQDRSIAFRQIAENKADRLTAPQLASVLDRELGKSGPTARHIAPLDYAQVRLDAAAGVSSASSTSATSAAAISALAPMGHHVLVGLRFDTRGDLDAELALRAPVFGDASAIELGVRAGDGGHANGAALADWWFAVSPTWAVQIGADYEVRSDARAFVMTLGVSRILRR